MKKDDPALLPVHLRAGVCRCLRLVVLVFLAGSIGLLAGCGKDEAKKDAYKKDGERAKARMAGEADAEDRTDKKDADFKRDQPAPDQAPPAPGVPGGAGVPGGGGREMAKKDAGPKGERPGNGKLIEGEKDKREASGRGGAAPPPKEKPKSPKVWHRDGSRPTFARVYIGDKNSLEFVSLQVSVTIEGARARTVVDHVFRNPHNRQLEGTFEYPLPAGASPSYFAMFLGAARDGVPQRFRPQVNTPGKKPIAPESLPPAQLARQIDTADWGRLQEARVVAPDKALDAYEEVVRGRIDPGLFEYASGNTFRGRVFPIQAKGYNRVLLSYEETLPLTEGRLIYRFALPGCELHELRFSLQADPRTCKEVTFEPKDAHKETADTLVAFSKTWSGGKPSGEVLFSAKPVDATVQATSGKHGDAGPLYLHARLRPQLPRVAKVEPFARHAVLLLDTSQSESSLGKDFDRFAVSMKLLQAILEADSSIEQFNVLTFNAGAAWVHPRGWLPNTKAGREAALSRLDGLLLEGATDLSGALEKLIAPGFAVEKGTPLNCFLLSDGHLTWGQTEVASLVARFQKRCPYPARFFCYRTGLGEENTELYEALTRDGGGVFQCFGEAEVPAAAKAHQQQCLQLERVRFTGGLGEHEVLVAGRRSAVYPDGELIVTARFPKAGKCKVVLEGRFAGQKFAQSFPVEIKDDGELAPRGWGEVAVASLLALNDPWTENLVTAYCQEFTIASRAASFLVLENQADYKRFHLDKEKEKTVKGDLGRYLEDAWSLLSKETSLKQTFSRLLLQINERTKVLSGGDSSPVKRLLALLTEEDCSLPNASVQGALLHLKDADKDYLEARQRDRRGVHAYLEECQRRYSADDPDGAVRVLSSIIEENPSRGDALRLVGYRLLDMRQPGLAARLFARVLRQRPFEPHSFRDLARSLEDARQFPLSALLYESVLAGTWHNRFQEALKQVTQEEYVRLLRTGLREGKLTKDQRQFFSKRLEKLGSAEVAADLRVSITWNTDNTDVDLWVIEPDKTRVFYQNPRSPAGGQLSADQTQGYGPERYHIAHAPRGEFKILVHYFRANPNLLGGETHVNVTITRYAGTDKEKVERRTVILRRQDEQVPVATIRF